MTGKQKRSIDGVKHRSMCNGMIASLGTLYGLQKMDY